MKELEKKHKFCFSDCWYLVISDVNQLLEYQDRTDKKYGVALVSAEEKRSESQQKIMQLAEYYAKKDNSSLLMGVCEVQSATFTAKLKYIARGEEIWINDKGGFNFGPKNKEVLTIYKEKMIFPNYTEKDIKIEQHGGNFEGSHFYARIGELEIVEYKDGEKILKWDTYEEAKTAALQYCLENSN